MATELKTIVSYQTDGIQKTFAFPFDYLKKEFIKARLDGGDSYVYGADYIVTSKQIEFAVAPLADQLLVIYRETDTKRLITWEDASILHASDMTLNQVQVLHVAEEARDRVGIPGSIHTEGALIKDTDGVWDAKSIRLKNLADPLYPNDAVTKNYLETVGGGGGTGVVQNGEIVFNTYANMIACTTLVVGDRLRTLGYQTPDDEGGAKYIVCNDTEAAGKVWAIPLPKSTPSNPQLYALIANKDKVTYKMFGAPLNGVDDDGPAMRKCHAYADSVYIMDGTGKLKQYLCKVENHKGIIYKKDNECINFCSDIDLSGSTLLVDDINATWYGYYVWGEVNSLTWDFEAPDETKSTFLSNNFVIQQPTTSDTLPQNCVLKLEEEPYTARDDAGYLYTVARRELLIHDANGICSSPLTDDWNYAGGEEINCQVSDLVNGGYKNMQTFTKFDCSYTFIPNKHGTFVGCDVEFRTSADKYCSVVWVKRHNATIKDFIFRPNLAALHNTAFKNTMVYLWDSYNVRVQNLQGFNASGQKSDSNGTSGYMLRLTNCSDVYIEDCRMQGYWGVTAMDSVKNIFLKRCHMNRLDTHDYFANLYAEDCTFYNHNIQIGYGRGVASFTNCNWFWNPIANDSYPNSHMVELNATYGRLFEGTIYINNCRVYTKNPPDGEFNIFVCEFSPDATSITKHYKFPEVIVKDCQFYADNPNTFFAGFKITGTRRAKTGTLAPSHRTDYSNDGTVTWYYIGRGLQWGGPVVNMTVDQILRVSDSFLDTDGKTQFYNIRYYRCTQAGGWSDWTMEKPTDTSGNPFLLGTAQLVYMPDALWQSKHAYAVGAVCAVSNSNWYPLYLFKCTVAGTSDGYFPTHTTGTVLDGINDAISEPDACWWAYVTTKAGWCTDWTPNMAVTLGQKIQAEGRLYEVTRAGTLLATPPYDTYWFGEHDSGTARLKFIGQRWQPQAWFKKDSYCEADGRIYQLATHDGTTSGRTPTRGNPYCVDGDHIWEFVATGGGGGSYQGETVNWVANTEYADGVAIKSGSNVYIAQQAITGTSQPSYATTVGTIVMDGDRRIQYLGKAAGWRKTSTAYSVGTLIYDNTFIVKCVTAGTTTSSGYGPVEGAAWSNNRFTDGSVVWEKVTPNAAAGVWRNSSTKYPSGKIYLCDVGETSGTVRVYKSLGGLSASSAPTDTSGTEFTHGTLKLTFAGTSGSGIPAWMAGTAYNLADQVVANGNIYRCAFDGKLTLPNKTVFENITTNMTSFYPFWFYTGNDIPTRLGNRSTWVLIARNCEGANTTPYGLTTYFGHSGNAGPTSIITT